MAIRPLYLLTSETNIQRIENDGNGAPIYIGKAAPGSAESAAVWQIQKLTYTNGAVTEINFADGSPAFCKSWTLRSSGGYVYR